MSAAPTIDPYAAAMARNAAQMEAATARRIEARRKRCWLKVERPSKLVLGEASTPREGTAERLALAQAVRQAEEARLRDAKLHYAASRRHPFGLARAEHLIVKMALDGTATSVLDVALGLGTMPSGVHSLVRKVNRKLAKHGAALVTKGHGQGWKVEGRDISAGIYSVNT